MRITNPIPGKGGNRYVPYDERGGESSVVFFRRAEMRGANSLEPLRR